MGGRRAWRLLGGCCGEGRCAWQLFRRVLRTLGGKNIGKCRLRAHQHPLLPPLPNLRRARSHANIQGKTRAGATDGTRAEGCAEDEPLTASILDFRGRLANRCKVFPVYALLRASILKFKPRFENRCKVFPGNSPKAASILDFMPRLANRCKVFAWKRPPVCSDS